MVPSSELCELIEAHKVEYAALGKAVHEMGGSIPDRNRASEAEEKALLAVCAYPAVREGDGLTKAKYLLEIEARGELAWLSACRTYSARPCGGCETDRREAGHQRQAPLSLGRFGDDRGTAVASPSRDKRDCRTFECMIYPYGRPIRNAPSSAPLRRGTRRV